MSECIILFTFNLQGGILYLDRDQRLKGEGEMKTKSLLEIQKEKAAKRIAKIAAKHAAIRKAARKSMIISPITGKAIFVGVE